MSLLTNTSLPAALRQRIARVMIHAANENPEGMRESLRSVTLYRAIRWQGLPTQRNAPNRRQRKAGIMVAGI